MSTYLEDLWQKDQYFSLVTSLIGSNETPTIKVYSITRYWVDLIKAKTYPWIVAPWTKVEFDVVVNISNSKEDVDYVEIDLNDQRFNPPYLRIFNEEVWNSNWTWTWSWVWNWIWVSVWTWTLKWEKIFKWYYIMPSDTSMNWEFIDYNISVVSKDWARTTFSETFELYLWSKDDLCRNTNVCIIRWLRALESDDKTELQKVIINMFTDNPENFSKEDIYEKFRKVEYWIEDFR